MAAMDYLKALVRDPMEAVALVQQRLAPTRQIARLERLGREAGLRRPAFLLSFDCDTDRDIAVVEQVHRQLADMGILPIYAVPGEILEAGADTWRRIRDTGAEFLNHGWRRHTDYRDGVYVSTVFYDQLSDAEVAEDIRRGHETLRAVLGIEAVGYRTPHFGTFQKARDLAKLHGWLSAQGYRFSSSSTPYWSWRHGPAFRRFGLTEVPVSGCPDLPMTVPDSYTFRFAQGRFGPDDYCRQIARWAEWLAEGRSFLVNLYADPSQVADWPEFFTAMAALAPFARPSFIDVLEDIEA